MQLGCLQYHRHRPECSDRSDRKKISINLTFEHGFLWAGDRRVRLPSPDTKEIEAPSFRRGEYSFLPYLRSAQFFALLRTAKPLPHAKQKSLSLSVSVNSRMGFTILQG